MKRASPIIAAIMLFFSCPMVVYGAVPSDIEDYCEEAGAINCICPEILESMGFYESRYNADAENGGCIGIMQINPRFHKERMKRLGVTDLTDPRGNILVAADYLAELFDKYEDVGTVLMTYNGAKRVRVQEYEETGNMTGYANKILSMSAELEREHKK